VRLSRALGDPSGWSGQRLGVTVAALERRDGVGGRSIGLAGEWLIGKGANRRLEFELGAGFEGACGFALVLALS
jgi:hypothetical protein